MAITIFFNNSPLSFCHFKELLFFMILHLNPLNSRQAPEHSPSVGAFQHYGPSK